MNPAWAVELHSDFLPSLDPYEAKYLSQDVVKILERPLSDQKAAAALGDIVLTVRHFKHPRPENKRLVDDIGDLPFSQINYRLRELRSGPWLVPILTDEKSNPKRALIFRIFHEKDLTKKYTDELVRSVSERLDHWPPKS